MPETTATSSLAKLDAETLRDLSEHLQDVLDASLPEAGPALRSELPKWYGKRVVRFLAHRAFVQQPVMEFIAENLPDYKPIATGRDRQRRCFDEKKRWEYGLPPDDTARFDPEVWFAWDFAREHHAEPIAPDDAVRAACVARATSEIRKRLGKEPSRPYTHKEAARHAQEIEAEKQRRAGVMMPEMRRLLKEEFPDQTGFTLQEIMDRFRVRRAVSMLLEPDPEHGEDRSCKEVARQAGFSNVQKMSAAFKRHTGMAPSEYAIKARKEIGRLDAKDQKATADLDKARDNPAVILYVLRRYEPRLSDCVELPSWPGVPSKEPESLDVFLFHNVWCETCPDQASYRRSLKKRYPNRPKLYLHEPERVFLERPARDRIYKALQWLNLALCNVKPRGTAEGQQGSEKTSGEDPQQSDAPLRLEHEPDEDGWVKQPLDEKAYLPATGIIERYPDIFRGYRKRFNRLTRILNEHPEIRRWKPVKRRLLVHLGDWEAFVQQEENAVAKAVAEVTKKPGWRCPKCRTFYPDDLVHTDQCPDCGTRLEPMKLRPPR